MRNTIIDTRDLAKELDELENELTTLEETRDEAIQADDEDEIAEAMNDLEEWLGDNEDRLTELRNLRDEIPEWEDGEALIADGYFEEYAQDLASDLYGNEINDARWPFTCINWKQAADELKQDYTYIDFDGDTWWYRA